MMYTDSRRLRGKPPFALAGDICLMPSQELRPSTNPWPDAVRRFLDSVLALALLLLLLPVLLTIALLVLGTSRGPLFYRQIRVGRGGRLFQICKFRTMQPQSDRLGPAVTSSDDTRVTPIGRVLRHTKLDELPQLWNVIRGEMSLVGPRPQVPRLVDHFDPALRHIVLHVRPGMTGPAALRFRREESLLAGQEDREGFYITQILPVKLEMDVRYVQTRSLGHDLRILTQTAWLFSAAPARWALGQARRRKHHRHLACSALQPIPLD